MRQKMVQELAPEMLSGLSVIFACRQFCRHQYLLEELGPVVEEQRMAGEQKNNLAEGQIGLYAISNNSSWEKLTLTADAWTGRFLVTVKVAGVFPSLSMGVKSILPFSDLTDLLFAVLVLIVVIRSRRIIYVVPILGNSILFAVLLSAFAAATLSFLCPSIKAIHVFVVSRDSPICQRTLGWRSSRGCRCR